VNKMNPRRYPIFRSWSFASVLFALLLLVAGQRAVAQTPLDPCLPKFGADSVETVKNVSLYYQYYRQKNYDDALPFWRYVFKHAPGSYKVVVKDGIVMFEYLIRKTEDEVLKQKYIDTLMMIFDQRIVCWDQEGYVLGRKATLLYKYRPNNTGDIKEIYDRSIELEGINSEYYILSYYFTILINAYEKELITKEVLLENYMRIMNIIKVNIEKGDATSEKFDAQRIKIERALVKNEIIADCSEAKDIYLERYNTNPEDTAIWMSMFDLLRSTGCTDEPIFIEVTEKLNAHRPEANLAYFLSKSKIQAGKIAEGIKYLKQAIELEDSKDKQCEYLLELAKVYAKKLNDLQTAYSYAVKAKNKCSNWGEPYLLIGDLYALSSKICGQKEEFDRFSVNWVAVDLYEKAKQVDPSVSSKANSKIRSTKKGFPSKEQCFFKELEERNTYTVPCWINKDTIVRYREE